MKTTLLALLLFPASLLTAQEIADARNEGSWIVVYDARGKELSKMSDAFDKKVLAVTGDFFVVQDNFSIETYDSKCKRLGSMFASGKKVRGAAGSTFTVEEGSFVFTYDSGCRRVSSFASVDPDQIADVREEGSSIVVYNAKGDRISSMSSSFNKRVVAIAGTFFVVQDDMSIETYDSQCRRLGSMFASGKTVSGAAGSTFTVEEGSWIVTYDSKCSRVSSRSK